MTSEEAPVPGARTLARGIAALQAVVRSPDGLSAQEVAEQLGVHRTIAHRMLVTLADARLICKGRDAKYRGAVGLMVLQSARYASLVHYADPLLEELSERLGATVTLLVAEGQQAVALAAHTPRDGNFQLTFSRGHTHPLRLAAGGQALRAIMPEYAGDPTVDRVRRDGYAITHGEVEKGAWGLAVPVQLPGGVAACLNLISLREDVVRDSVPDLLAAAASLEEQLNAEK